MGRAAEIVGCTPDFLRRLGEAKLIDPVRSGGGHRRYSRYQIRLAARAREMCDQGTDMASAVRIILLEDQVIEGGDSRPPRGQLEFPDGTNQLSRPVGPRYVRDR